MLAMATMLAAGLSPADAVVRVKEGASGPQVWVDGKPVPPRVFFGSRRGGSLAVTTDWQPYQVDFVPGVDVPGNGTLHFRFTKDPQWVELRHLRIVATDGSEAPQAVGTLADAGAFAKFWNTWPPAERNTVGTAAVADGVLRVELRAPADGKWPDFHLHSQRVLRFTKGKAYRCEFEARASQATELRPAVYRVEGGVWQQIASPPCRVFTDQVALARDAGVNFVSTTVPTCWQSPDTPQDWSAADHVMREIIGVNPKALVIARVGANAPGWWLKEHPEAVMTFEDGSKGNKATVSCRPYREAATEQMAKLSAHLMEAFPDNFAGIHPCGQNTGEWFYDQSWGPIMSGYDVCTRDAWRAWLVARGEPGAETAGVPAAEARHGHPAGFLRDPAKERSELLFDRFRQEEMADFILSLAAACRRGTQGRKLVVFFYGYGFEFPPLRNGAPYSGHYSLAKVLASPDIDILCSPISYFDRGWPGTAPCMSPAESVMAAGKLWLNEDDTRTYLAKTTRFGGVADLEQTIDVMRRNGGQALVRGFGTWWMDLPGQNWFGDARIWDVQRELNRAETLRLSQRPFRPDIAAIIGEDAMCHLTGGSNVLARPLVYEARAALGRCGAPYGQYLLRDAVAGRVPAKLQILLAAWSMTAKDRKTLKANRVAGTTRVWCYAPGYSDGERRDVDLIRETSGFRVHPVALPNPVATPTEKGKAAGLPEPWGQETAITPLFAVEPEAGDEIWATYSDGSAAAVLRRGDRGVDVYLGTPAWTSSLVRAFARTAGVHLFTETDANVWATKHFLSVHAMDDGPLQLSFSGSGAVLHDEIEGKRIGAGQTITVPFRQGQTRVFSYAPIPNGPPPRR
jgi:hypothetical protein